MTVEVDFQEVETVPKPVTAEVDFQEIETVLIVKIVEDSDNKNMGYNGTYV